MKQKQRTTDLAHQEFVEQTFEEACNVYKNIMLPFHEWYRRLNNKVIRVMTIVAKREGLKEEDMGKYLGLKVPKIMMVYLAHYGRFLAMMNLSDYELRIKNCNEWINFKQDSKMAEIEEIVGKYRAEEAILSRKLQEDEYLNPIMLRPIEDAFIDGGTGRDLITEMKMLEKYYRRIPDWAWNADEEEFRYNNW